MNQHVCEYGWIPINDKEKYERYSIEVWSETNKHKKELFEQWDGVDYYTKEKLLIATKDYNHPMYRTIDHKLSIKYGFDNNISPNVIGELSNLCICSRKNNSSKKHLTECEFIIKCLK